MNEVVLRLAHDSAVYLESVCLESTEDNKTHATQFFSRLGIRFNAPDSGNSFETIDDLCNEINKTLNDYEKVYLLLLIHDCLLALHDIPVFRETLNVLYSCLGIDSQLHTKFRHFFEQENLYSIDTGQFMLLSPQNAIDNEMLEGRWIEDNIPRARVLPLSQVQNHLLVMFVEQIRSYVVRSINSVEKVFDQDISEYCSFRLLLPGGELSINGIPVITFSDIKSRFLQSNEKRELTLSVDSLQYTNRKGVQEIYSFSTHEITGRLIGIVGREGVGKSTLLKLMAGKFKPGSGNISINGYDLWKNKYFLKGVIGFVPEEDLLFEELSVADNLMLTARLYYSNLTKKEIDSKVNALLGRLELFELKHMIVGDVNSKHIQPGQRRLINIALELLREPQILLVDNALSGLGMSDACKVIKVLHDYSFEGNLVITSISQVDSETFLLFDKIWILDEGGYPVYNGPVNEVSGYLFRNLKLSFQEKEKSDPAKLLDWINYRLPDKSTHVWKRVVEPEAWHHEYLRNIALNEMPAVSKMLLPARILKIPNLENQLWIFSIRNFKCKFSRIDEIIKALLVGPLAALIISLLFRMTTDGGYSLLNNENLPVYQFISVVVAIFLGLIAGIDEIHLERNILEKEEYQEFSRFSYLNSKILYLFPVVALQVTLYLITGNLILEINELFGVYWLVLFSSACFGVLLGLAISSGMHNKNMVYKSILPFIIIIQLLLGGGIIPYSRLNLGNDEHTPIISDIMVSRWGYEALAVEQFKNNAFEKMLYKTDQKIDEASFYAFHAIPKMEQALSICLSSDNEDSVKANLSLLKHEIAQVGDIPGIYKFELSRRLSQIPTNEEIAEETYGYISNYLSNHFFEQYDTSNRQKFVLMGRLADSLGAEKLAMLRRNYHNLALEETVTNYSGERPYKIINNKIVKISGMIFQKPESDWGRAPLYSPVKVFRRQVTETLWFNIAMIWLLVSFFYIWTLFDFTGLISRLFQVNSDYSPRSL